METCPYCKAKTTETVGYFSGGKFQAGANRNGLVIRTVCDKCRTFLGYRYVDKRKK